MKKSRKIEGILKDVRIIATGILDTNLVGELTIEQEGRLVKVPYFGEVAYSKDHRMIGLPVTFTEEERRNIITKSIYQRLDGPTRGYTVELDKKKAKKLLKKYYY